MNFLDEKIICMLELERVMKDLSHVETPEYTEKNWKETLQLIDLLGRKATQQEPADKVEGEHKQILIEEKMNLFPNSEPV